MWGETAGMPCPPAPPDGYAKLDAVLHVPSSGLKCLCTQTVALPLCCLVSGASHHPASTPGLVMERLFPCQFCHKPELSHLMFQVTITTASCCFGFLKSAIKLLLLFRSGLMWLGTPDRETPSPCSQALSPATAKLQLHQSQTKQAPPAVCQATCEISAAPPTSQSLTRTISHACRLQSPFRPTTWCS